MFDDLFKKRKYHYVAPCPHCHSNRTGYVLNTIGTSNDCENEKFRCLLNGELVEVHNFTNEEATLFCADCKLNWFGIPEIVYKTPEEIEEERIKRQITDDYILNRCMTRKNKKILKKRMKENQKREKKAKNTNKTNVKVKVKTAEPKVKK